MNESMVNSLCGIDSPWDRLIRIMSILRSPEGCPWDREQTHLSIRDNLKEECGELLEAIDANDGDGMREELGDVLLQTVFHAQIAAETGRFTINDVLETLCEKLISRHPHVFGEGKALDAKEAIAFWKEAKNKEKGSA